MLELLSSSSIVLLSIGTGLSDDNLKNNYTNDYIQPVSYTMSLDPWESYNTNQYQKISDKILEQEILEWLD